MPTYLAEVMGTEHAWRCGRVAFDVTVALERPPPSAPGQFVQRLNDSSEGRRESRER